MKKARPSQTGWAGREWLPSSGRLHGLPSAVFQTLATFLVSSLVAMVFQVSWLVGSWIY